jgi:hypothetical protein
MSTPARCQAPGHEDRPATVTLRRRTAGGFDGDWLPPGSPNACTACADAAMRPLALAADRALKAERQRLRGTGLTGQLQETEAS